MVATLKSKKSKKSVPASSRKLYAHQKDGVRFLCGVRHQVIEGVRLRGCILADEMGLGKTTTALVAARVHRAENPKCKIIVICPKSLTGNWRNEAEACGVKPDLIVSNHAASFPEGMEGQFVVIVDEAHCFQSPDSARTRKLLALVNGRKIVRKTEKDEKGNILRSWDEEIPTGDAAVSVYLLTGTPIKNGRPHNLLPLLQAINHGIVSSKDRVKDYLFGFCGPERNPFGWTFNGATNLEQLHKLTKCCILRRMKAECLDLPAKTRVVREAELSAEQERAYNHLLAQMQAEYSQRLAEGKIKPGGDTLVFLNQLRRAGSIAKADAAVEIAEEVVEEGGQIAIFTCFRESAELIARNFGVQVFDGTTSTSQRDQIVADFRNGKTKVFVGIDKAGGVGITLHANGNCQHVLLVDRPWTPGDALQLEDRCHRIGQTNAVTAYWLQYGTMDETVDDVLQVKFANAEKVLTGQDGASIDFGGACGASDMAEAVLDALGWQ